MSDQIENTIQDAIYELEQAQDEFGEYDHGAVDHVLEMLRQVSDE